MDASRIAVARQWARAYRSQYGFNCLPSDPTRKKPLVKFAQWWDEPCPPDLLSKFDTTNLQIMCGVRWGLCVLDLDGKDAVEYVAKSWPKLPRTWVSYHGNGRGSRHVWFATPPRAEPRGKAVLWSLWDDAANAWKKHTAIELLCDRCLIMAPPSIHPGSGRPYQFEMAHSPQKCKLAVVPDWLWNLPPIQAPTSVKVVDALPPFSPLPPLDPRPKSGGKYPHWRQVLDGIPSYRQVAESWGLRFARSSSESSGWVSVHDFNRDDANPSASFNVISGHFWRPGMLKPLNLLGLGVEMGHYATWQDCRDALADYYGIR